jgi:hypothetical protein
MLKAADDDRKLFAELHVTEASRGRQVLPWARILLSVSEKQDAATGIGAGRTPRSRALNGATVGMS